MPTKDGTCCNVMARFSSESYAPIVSIINGICWYDAASKKDICDAGGNSDSQCLLNSQPCKFTCKYFNSFRVLFKCYSRCRFQTFRN